MFSDDSNFANPKFAPNWSSDIKVIEIIPYPEVNGTSKQSFFTLNRQIKYVKKFRGETYSENCQLFGSFYRF